MAVSGDLNSASILAEVDELEILVEKLIAGGDGFARHNGVPIFVPLAVPGDRLRVVITKRAAQYVRASIALSTSRPFSRSFTAAHDAARRRLRQLATG